MKYLRPFVVWLIIFSVIGPVLSVFDTPFTTVSAQNPQDDKDDEGGDGNAGDPQNDKPKPPKPPKPGDDDDDEPPPPPPGDDDDDDSSGDDDDDDDYPGDDDDDDDSVGNGDANDHLNQFVVTELPKIITDRAQGAAANKNPHTAGAGDVFKNITWQIEGQFADIDDDMLGGDGEDWDVSLWATSYYGAWTYGLGITYDEYGVQEGIADVDQQSLSIDFFILYNIIDNLNIGAFIDSSWIDTDSGLAVVKGVPTLVKNDDDHYWGAGLLANYWIDIDPVTLSFASTLGSMLKDDLGDIFNSEDTVWLNSVTASVPLDDNVSIDTFVMWSHFLDRSADRDESFGTVGGDLNFQISEAVGFAVGISHDFAESDVDRTAGRVAFTFGF